MNDAVTINEEAAYWVTCEKEGLSPLEAEALQTWLAKNPLHVKAYGRIKHIHTLSSSLSKTQAQHLSAAAHRGAKKTKRVEQTKRFARIAALVAVIFTGAFVAHDAFYVPTFTQTYVADTQPVTKHVLPDGSVVSYDAKTQMSVAFYKNKRVVSLLHGAAMFEVAKDEKNVFVVQSDKVNVEVVGTRFEVIRTPESTTVNVEEGVVRTYYKDAWFQKQDEALLTSADSITYGHEGATVHHTTINPNAIAMWRENRISFHQTSLKNATEEFSKYTNATFSFAVPEIETYQITGIFSSHQLDIFLNTLTKIYPVKVTKNGLHVEISKKSR